MSLGAVISLYTCAGFFGLALIPGVVGLAKVSFTPNKTGTQSNFFRFNSSYEPKTKQKISFQSEATQALL